MSIISEFANFGSEMSRLRKQLRDLPNVTLFASFSEYADHFCRIVGIRQRETALDLFFQTVSMKSVGNLTDFVRNQMLGRTDVRDRIETMTRSFDDLRLAHDAVRTVQHQLAVLQPLVDDRVRYEDASAQRQHLQACKDAVPTYVAYLSVDLLKADLHRHNHTLKTLRNDLADIDRQTTDRQRELTDLQVALKGNEKGQRLDALSQEITRLETERDKRRAAAQSYAGLVQQTDLSVPTSADEFYYNQQQLTKLKTALEQEVIRLQAERDALVIKQEAARTNRDTIAQELNSLDGRRTKIPGENINLRQRLLDAVGLAEADLPYAGELLRVSEGEEDWEGAAERRLRGLGMTLLVRADYYERVSEWVNRQSLRGRLVYNTIPADYRQQKSDISPLRPSLVNKIDIRNDTEFFDWLTDQLLNFHDLTCCDTLSEFRREPFAITREGQIKGGRGRHEKDDTHKINDSSRYVLGWSNADKIRVLRQQLVQADSDCKTVVGQVADMDHAIRGLAKKQAVLHELTRFTDYADMDWTATAQRIEKRVQDRQQLTNEAGELAVLEQQIEAVAEQLGKLSDRKESKSRLTGQEENKVRQTANDLYEAFALLNVADETVLQGIFPDHEQMLETFDTWLTLIDEQPIPDDRLTDPVRQTLLTFNEDTAIDRGRVRQLANDVPKKLDQMIGLREADEKKLRDNLVKQMGEYRHTFPVESADFSNDMRDLALYVARYNLLNDSELARHEARFRELLQRGTIHEVALFDTYLRQRETDIAEKIDLINEHLKQVSYSPTSYVQLTRDRVRGGSAEAIDDFRNELRACSSRQRGRSRLQRSQIRAGEATPRPPGEHPRRRPALGRARYRRAAVVHVWGERARPRNRAGTRILQRRIGEIGRAEREISLHHSGLGHCVPVRAERKPPAHLPVRDD